jgi:hypothetical protein
VSIGAAEQAGQLLKTSNRVPAPLLLKMQAAWEAGLVYA